MADLLLRSQLDGLPPPRRGKVRDIYDLGDELLIVATDRISAYDHVLRPGIPGKGKILTQLSNFWFRRMATRASRSTMHRFLRRDAVSRSRAGSCRTRTRSPLA